MIDLPFPRRIKIKKKKQKSSKKITSPSLESGVEYDGGNASSWAADSDPDHHPKDPRDSR